MIHRNLLNRLTAALLLAAVMAFSSPVFAQSSDRKVLRDRIEWLSSASEPTIDGTPIAAVRLITKLYERRGYEPAWTDPAMIEALFDLVLRSVGHGLNPEDFHARQLGARLRPGAHTNDAVFHADTEILCTDALARLAVTLRFGKLDPADLDPAWNFSREIRARDPVEAFDTILRSGNLTDAVESLDPNTDFYNRLRRALVRYRGIMAAGGWPAVPAGPVLKLGSFGPRVATLRNRLSTTGDLTAPNPPDPSIFDDRLESGVKSFQARHGIDPDGKVGPRSIEELNIPVSARINQIRASLERMRWVFRDLPEDFLVVDIAGFHAYLFRDGEEIWSTRVQVGKPFHATPVFKDSMRFLDFNPTWTIPPGILRNEILPAIRRDPDYLRRNNMSVVTTAGKVVDPSTIDWPATASKGFPYMIRQEPGPGNALGRVKFMFPNKYMVYLHDTPSKGLFARSERAFSHGCIRTENPFELATLLLGDQGWDRARIDQVVASKKTTRVNLSEPLTVMLLYWTAEADENGAVFFRKDLYDRDAPIIEGLDEPFRASPPKGVREAVEELKRP
ncbi:MAG: murein L,D-transpeptidase [Thermoanaerobaculales bacterium]